MDIKASEIQAWARANIVSLTHDPAFGNKTKAFHWLAKQSGISESLIREFTRGARPNLTVATLDRLVDAIKAAKLYALAA